MNEDKIIAKLLEHDEKFESAKEELSKFREEFLSGQDAMMTILKRLDEERVHASERTKRLEGIVEKHDNDIRQIKTQLKMA